MILWGKERNGDVITTTGFDENTGHVVTSKFQDMQPITDVAKERQKEFRGFGDAAFTLAAQVPMNLHLHWLNSEGYDFMDFTNNPWEGTVKKMKADNLQHFFTIPNGGYS